MAGFEIRDSIGWVYGSGFPKSLDVSKAIQKASGVEPTGYKENKDGRFYGGGDWNETPRQLFMPEPEGEAKKWQGWGTALKPALEPIVVARKPLIGTVAENVLTHGTGGLNIDASRIGTTKEGDPNRFLDTKGFSSKTIYAQDNWTQNNSKGVLVDVNKGRWPANLILDEYTAELLDEQSGQVGGGNGEPIVAGDFGKNGRYSPAKGATTQSYKDKGGASRFFYVAKASKRDRNEGLEDLEAQRHSDRELSDGAGGDNPRNRTNNAKQNFHPTVKPTSLMQYLVKLVTPPNGTVLDPFTGSGSTGKAAILEGFDFIGIELTEDYWPIIEGRLKHAEAKVAEAKENIEAQPQGLF
jgi:site-specific DNA-methyltransferase (adenine-specific)